MDEKFETGTETGMVFTIYVFLIFCLVAILPVDAKIEQKQQQQKFFIEAVLPENENGKTRRNRYDKPGEDNTENNTFGKGQDKHKAPEIGHF